MAPCWNRRGSSSVGSLQDTFDDHVRAKLESSFGKAVAMMIVASATTSTCATIVNLQQDDYLKLCEAICTDQRVVAMWGSAETEETLRQWKVRGAA